MRTTTSSILRRTGAGLAAALLLVGLTACAPDTPKDGNGDVISSGSTLTPEQWRIDMDDCMAKAGFDMGSGDTSEPVDISKFDMVAFDAAYGTCMNQVGEPPIDENIPTDEEIFESQLIFAGCMRENGYDYPDPVKGEGGMSPAMGPEVDPNVVDKCGELAYDFEDAKCPSSTLFPHRAAPSNLHA